MNFILLGHNYENEIQTITQVFYPNEKFVKLNYSLDNIPNISEKIIVSIISDCECLAYIYKNGNIIAKSTSTITSFDDKYLKKVVKDTMYEALKLKTGFKPPWGKLTGIRPSKKVRELLDKGFSNSEIISIMHEQFEVDKDKISLAINVALSEIKIIQNNNGSDFSLYIGIPFCPTKCLYCSFTSYAINKYENIVDKYLNCLYKEMEFVKKFSKGRYLETIYIGGGTPTSLNEAQLESLLENINYYFNIGDAIEFTVEAGRPDTITEEKLLILKKYGVNRISINAQTANNKTLEVIGRQHTYEQFLNAFYLARETGHKNINIDLILGLPNENINDVLYTLEQIGKLSPENITVHVLAIKRGSQLKENIYFDREDYSYILNSGKEVEKMIKLTDNHIKNLGLNPYYMYRQKNMIGNLENVGYCKEGYECIYNVQIMEEKQTIIAIGAGATTKTVDLSTNKIERTFNVKNVDEYINRIDEMILRKEVGVLKYPTS